MYKADGVGPSEGQCSKLRNLIASNKLTCGVEDPKQAGKLHAREPGDPAVALMLKGKGAGRRTR